LATFLTYGVLTYEEVLRDMPKAVLRNVELMYKYPFDAVKFSCTDNRQLEVVHIE